MKKAILFSLVVGMILMFASLAMAKKDDGAVPQPANLTCSVGDGLVTFNWDDVTEAVKYSLDVDVEIDSDNDGENDMTVEFSVSTIESLVNIAITDFKYDIDGNGSLDQLTGPATAKVKGLDPGKKKRQNNLFSLPCDFVLP